MIMIDVFYRFFILGWLAFGGPAAHIGFFQQQFVQRRQWLDQNTFNELLAVSQVLPGPGSSQLGMAIGYQRAGLAGFVAAFVGFTLPNALILSAIYFGYHWLAQATLLVTGFKLLAVAVVADALVKMAKTSLTSYLERAIVIASLVLGLLATMMATQYFIIGLAGVLGAFGLANTTRSGSSSGNVMAWPLLIFALLFAASLIWSDTIAGGFYQVGASVFGGGHVMLAMLQSTSVIDSLSNEQFGAGYGLIQALPGPMFSVSMLFGSELGGWAYGWVALAAIFLPGALLMLAWLPARQRLQQYPRLQGAVRGINAGVIGLLASVFYQSLWLPIAEDVLAVSSTVILFVLIAWWQRPIWQLLPLALVLGGIVSYL